MKDEQNSALLELLSGIYITNLRIYDMLVLISDELNDKPFLLLSPEEIVDMHEQGHILGPDPALIIDEENSDD